MHFVYIATPAVIGFLLGYRFAKRPNSNSPNKDFKEIEDNL